MPLPPLEARAVRLGRVAADKHDAIEQAGRVLVDIGAAADAYVAAMHERERSLSTFIGASVAIPHGDPRSWAAVKRPALSYLQFPDGVDWGEGYTVKVVVGVASQGDEHLTVLTALAKILMVAQKAEAFRTASSADEVLALFHAE
jgi:mannitol/fructose-specific phosphotransferase system IIA component